jgi:hypothetical protein
MRNAYKILIGKPEGKRPLGRPGRSWEDSIRMDIMETCEGVDWIHLAQDRDQWRALEHGNETSGSIKGGNLTG